MYIPALFQHRHQPHNNFSLNVIAFFLMTGGLVLIGWWFSELHDPITVLQTEPVIIDPAKLFEYSIRTTLRMFVAMICSVIFSLVYGSIAAKSKRAGQIMVPLLDILQSVPILGYISFAITGFLLLFPGSMTGAELAAIFAIFTSQVWNMTFSVYQSFKTVPSELYEASNIFGMSNWQRFWRLEIPFAIPSLVNNMMISMSGGWFFVVAAEVMNVGEYSITLPGIGSYIALALLQKDVIAILEAILAMALVIIIYDQLILKTLIAWSDRFRYELSGGGNEQKSWVLNLFRHSYLIKLLIKPISSFSRFFIYLPIFAKKNSVITSYRTETSYIAKQDYLWNLFLVILFLITSYSIFVFINNKIGLAELFKVIKLTAITTIRVFVLLIVASIIWVPIGIYIGQKPKLAAFAQPIAQFLAAFPANLLFPVAVILISKNNLNPNIWLTPLMMIGAQWYILFNVIAGSKALPNEFKEISQNFQLRGTLWWQKIMIPSIIPYYITGAITASGGAWNASIVAEVVSWGNSKIMATGIGSYISEVTLQADFPKIILGIGVMSMVVVLLNQFFWQPLYNFSVKKYKF